MSIFQALSKLIKYHKSGKWTQLEITANKIDDIVEGTELQADWEKASSLNWVSDTESEEFIALVTTMRDSVKGKRLHKTTASEEEDDTVDF